MKTKIEKVLRYLAAGIFFVALALNVKFTLDSPYFLTGNELVAQTTGTDTGSDTGTGTDTGTNGDCECKTPEWFHGTCNQRKESILNQCTVTTTTRKYFDASGKVVGTAIFTGGVLTAETGTQTGVYSDTVSTSTFTATRVNCPTDGNGNTCEEYHPC